MERRNLFAVWQLAFVFVGIALHRRGPDELPVSRFLLGWVLVVYFVLALITIQTDASWLKDLLYLVLDRVLYLGIAWLLLLWLGKPGRFVQTAIALVGTDAFLTLLSIPLALWQGAADVPAGEAAAGPWVFAVIILLWSIDIGAYIFSRALARPYVMGIGIVLVYLFASVMLSNALFPIGN